MASRVLAGVAALAAASAVQAFDMSRSDNVVAYWGQNSIGASGGSKEQWQKSLGDYCDDDSVDTFPVSFLTVYFGTGGVPEINLANTCNANDNEVYNGTALPKCEFLSADIEKCQAKGKIVTLSIGGATGGNLFTDDAQAQGFATQVWNMFMGGTNDIRPFGKASLDGIDLDIEGGSSAGYAAFVEQLRKHYAEDSSKKYYVTAAPQCPFPDAYLGPVLDAVALDAIYIQFYNNYCGVYNYGAAAGQGFNYDMWEEWAETKAPNKDVKLYIGAPGATGGANAGSYVDAATLVKIATETRAKSKHFGGLMYWDISQAVGNSNFNVAVKDGIRDGSAPAPSSDPVPSSTEAPGTTSTDAPAPTETTPTETEVPPTSSAPPQETTTSSAPQPTESEDPCPPEDPTSTDPPAPTETPTEPMPTEDPCSETDMPEPPATETSAPTAPTGLPPIGACAGTTAWDAATVYTGGMYATFDGKTYKAKWWTQGEQPGSAGVWEEGICGSNVVKRDVRRGNPARRSRFNPHGY
ncbi:glycoside hydrolase [Auriculariales sp. MPI-PUGE-AT-0066]|nr:glycoside hydrolase [Auriculariales sp. MPI-PUGE-AT-0066]